MSEMMKRDLIVNGVDEACELLKELTEIPGLYFLEFKFICDSSIEAPSIDYHVIKYAGMEKNHEK